MSIISYFKRKTSNLLIFLIILTLCLSPVSSASAAISNDSLNSFNTATSIDEMKVAMTRDWSVLHYTAAANQLFLSFKEADQNYLANSLLDKRPQGGYTTTNLLRETYMNALNNRSFLINVNNAIDSFDLWTVFAEDTNLDYDAYNLLTTSEQDEVCEKLLQLRPIEGYKTLDELQLQLDTIIKGNLPENQYQVTFETNGGTPVNNMTVEHNQVITAPTPPTKEDYTFEGWYSDISLETAYDFNKPVTSNLILYAKWTINKYDVTFDPNGGSAVNKLTVEYNKQITAPTPPTKTGFTFGGWYSDATLNTAFDFSTPVTKNLTLYAKWTALATYSVLYNGNDSTSGTAPVDNSAYMEEALVKVESNSGDLAKVGYTFAGWNTKADGTGTAYLPNSMLKIGKVNVTLYAQWSINKYDVTFETNGGSSVNSLTVEYNEVLSAPAPPTKADYTFEGWYSDADLITAYDFSTPVTSNLGLFAKWTAVPSYFVVYNDNGSSSGTAPTDNNKYTKDATVTVAGNQGDLAKVGYTFAGWNTKADGMGNAYLPNAMLKMGEENLTLYAQWTINQYDVTFNTNGGSAVPAVTIEHNKSLILPSAPTKAGFTFDGWYRDASTTIKFDPTTKVTGNSTLYAKWTKIVSEDSSNPAPTSPPTKPTTEEIVVDVVDDKNPNELLVRTPVTRTTEHGLVKDVVTFTPEKALESVEKLVEKESKVSRIVIPDNKDVVSETTVNVPKAAVSTLSNGETSLSIRTINAAIFIPNTSLSTFTDDLYFRVVPVKKEEEKIAIETRAKQEEQVKEVVKVDNAKIEILGRPMTIETNMQNRSVTLTLPLPTKATQEQLNNLAVFIEHSDGTKEILRGRIVTFATGVQGVEFDVNHFSTFTVLYLEGAANYFAALDENAAEQSRKHLSYIQGYGDGTFRPNAAITRQQMAAMLARQLTKNEIPKASHSSYNDMSAAWAKDEIEYVRSVGIMTGTTADTFAPNSAITRAQMAAIAVRWIDKQCNENQKTAQYCTPTKKATTFTDVPPPHWAAQYIARISEMGIMTGMEDGTFRPQEKLTRAQAVKVLNRLLNRGPMTETISDKFLDVTPKHWAHYEIQEAAIDHDYTIVDGKERVQHEN